MYHHWGIILLTLTAAASVDKTAHADPNVIFERLDSNNDGYLEDAEIGDEDRTLYRRLLRKSDANRDGRLSVEEFSQATTRRRQDSVRGRNLSDDAVQRVTRRDKTGQRGARLEQVFERLDTNQDEQLTVDEIPAFRRDQFERMLENIDDDDDGAVTQSQFVNFLADRQRRDQTRRGDRKPNLDRRQRAESRGKRRRPFPDRLMEILDSDRDGSLSESEVADASTALLNLDKDGDGALSREELRRRRKDDGSDNSPNRKRRERLEKKDKRFSPQRFDF